MGKSNALLRPVYARLIHSLNLSSKTNTAVLGSPGPCLVSSTFENADYFDRKLGNWDINSEWNLGKTYDLIISTRCPYFAKNPNKFIDKCHSHLNTNGSILLDWGYGDHWRFPLYKIGWVKSGEQEYCYEKTNYLWSGIWDESFLQDPQFILFSNRVKKFGYTNVKKAIFNETPYILLLKYIKEKFSIKVELLTLHEDNPQLYIFITGVKNVLQ